MGEPRILESLLPRLAYVFLACLIIFVRLLPLHLPPVWGIAAPDLLLALTLAILFRRPDVVPLWLIALVFLVADLLLFRPPGLWTLLVVVATEIVRDRQVLTRTLPLPLELVTVAGIVGGLTVAEWCAWTLFLLDDPGLLSVLLGILATLVCYPALVYFVQSGLKLNRHNFPGGRPFGRVL